MTLKSFRTAAADRGDRLCRGLRIGIEKRSISSSGTTTAPSPVVPMPASAPSTSVA